MPKYIKIHDVRYESVKENDKRWHKAVEGNIYAVFIDQIIYIFPNDVEHSLPYDNHQKVKDGCVITLNDDKLLLAWESLEEVLKLINEAE